jgi:hypothetical protein
VSEAPLDYLQGNNHCSLLPSAFKLSRANIDVSTASGASHQAIPDRESMGKEPLQMKSKSQ